MLVLLLVAIGLFGGTSFAKPWKFSTDLEKTIGRPQKKLKLRGQTSKQDIQKLLRLIEGAYELSGLKAKELKDHWVIYQSGKSYVKRIELRSTTRKIKTLGESIAQKFVGKIDDPRMRSRIRTTFFDRLRNSGYPNAIISIKSKSYVDGNSYIVHIDQGFPCRISKVSYSFNLPENIDSTVNVGDVCNTRDVSDKIDLLEDHLRALGYKDHRLQFKGFRYASSKKTAAVFISGELGRRTTFEVFDKSKLFIIDDLFSLDNPLAIDPNISNPEVMRLEVQKFYRRSGYEQVVVSSPRLSHPDANTDHYRFSVNPGPRFLLNTVDFEGATIFSKSELVDALGLFGFFRSVNTYNREELDQGLDRIKQLYQEKGYWDVKVLPPRTYWDRVNNTVTVVVVIKEGNQRYLDSISFTGNTVFGDSDLRDLLNVDQGESINKRNLIELEESLKDQYVRKGYNYTDIEINVRSFKELRRIKSRVKVSIKEGVRVRIGTVRIVGLIQTRAKVVKRELLFASGQWYDPDKLSQSRSSLINLGLFRSVHIVTKNPTPAVKHPDVLDVMVEVFEGYPGSVVFGPGYNFERGVYYATEMAYNNINGLGRKISLKAAISQEKNQYSISNKGDRIGKTFLGRKFGIGYVEPYVLGLPIDANVNLTHKGVADNIWTISNAFDLALPYRMDRFVSGGVVTPYYSVQVNKDESSKQQEESLIATGDTRIARVGIRSSMDFRENKKWISSDGSLLKLDTSWAREEFGSEYNFFKWDISFNYFKRLADRLAWVNGLSLTSYENIERINSNNVEVLPSAERLTLSGSRKVRGFEHGLGPYVRSSGRVPEPIGGTKRSIFKSAVRYKFTESLGSSIFVDSGNTFFPPDELEKFKQKFKENENFSDLTIEDNMHYKFGDLVKNPSYLYSKHYLSYGFSLNYITPLGPIYLSFSFPWKEPVSDTCENDGFCFKRGNQNELWFKRAKIDLNIGTEF